MLTLLEDRINTPLGELCILADNQFNLRAVEWQEHRWRLDKLLHIHYGKNNIQLTAAVNPDGLSDAFHAYFAGDVNALNALPTATPGTPFQQQVWQALRTIPCGEVLYYGQLAALLGRPTAARAVGAANGANPLSIVVPCHRVIGRDGSMTGYAGGVARKAWLLRHEGFFVG